MYSGAVGQSCDRSGPEGSCVPSRGIGRCAAVLLSGRLTPSRRPATVLASSTSTESYCMSAPILPRKAPKWMPSGPSTCSETSVICLPYGRRRRESHLLKIVRKRWAPASVESSPALLAKSLPSVFARANISVGEGGQFTVARRISSRESRSSSRTSRPRPSEEVCSRSSDFLRSLLRTKPLWGLIGSRLWEPTARRLLHIPGPARAGADL